jgi:hypothetical protein
MFMTRRSAVIIAVSAGLMAAVVGAMSGSAGAATAGPLNPAAVPGATTAQATTGSPAPLTFAGYQWTVKNSTSPIGPGPNLFDAAGPFVDSSGALHLQIVKTAAGWESSEVVLNRTLGYGTYRWTVDGPLSTLDPNVVLALFTYDNSTTSPTNREIDFEASRFATPGDVFNAQYVVQPYETPFNLQRITLPNTNVHTITMTWLPGKVTFSADSLPLWTNSSSSVPTSSTEQVHMSLWLYRGVPPSNAKPVSVEVTNFQFTPPPPPPTATILLPSAGATLSGSTYLGASAQNATSVEFRIFGGIYGFYGPVLCTATPTLYGWLCAWNTKTVPNGSYYLSPEALNSGGNTLGPLVSVTVKNPSS